MCCGSHPCRGGWHEKNRNRQTDDARGEEPPPCLRTARKRASVRVQDSPRSPSARREERQAEGQSALAWSDLCGGSIGIGRPCKARNKRPRQNSQERSLSQPGSACSIISASRLGPITFSRRRTSSKVARFIAWAMMRSSECG